MAEQTHHIHYSRSDIDRYLRGELSAADMHELEKAALQDPFLADAIEGYAAAEATVSREHLAQIEAALLQPAQEEARVVPLQRSFYRSWMNIAAAVIVLAGTGLLGWYFIQRPQQGQGPATTLSKTDHPLQVVVPPPVAADTIRPLTPEDNTMAAEKSLPVTENSVQQSVVTIAPQAPNANGSMASRKQAQESLVMTETRRPVSEEKETAPILMPVPANPLEQQLQGRMAGLSVSKKENKPMDTAALNDMVVVGYGTQKKRRLDSLRTARIQLDEVDQSLAEVVVTEMYSRKKSAALAVEKDTTYPSGGWQSFQEYVARKLNRAVDTTGGDQRFTGVEIELEILVEKDGNPRNVRIIRSNDNTINNQAIEAVKNGPRWITSSRKKKTRVIVRF